jgi:hypothetical protein
MRRKSFTTEERELLVRYFDRALNDAINDEPSWGFTKPEWRLLMRILLPRLQNELLERIGDG